MKNKNPFFLFGWIIEPNCGPISDQPWQWWLYYIVSSRSLSLSLSLFFFLFILSLTSLTTTATQLLSLLQLLLQSILLTLNQLPSTLPPPTGAKILSGLKQPVLFAESFPRVPFIPPPPPPTSLSLPKYNTTHNEFAFCPSPTAILRRQYKKRFRLLHKPQRGGFQFRYRPLFAVPAIHESGEERVVAGYRAIRHEFLLLQSLCFHGRFCRLICWFCDGICFFFFSLFSFLFFFSSFCPLLAWRFALTTRRKSVRARFSALRAFVHRNIFTGVFSPLSFYIYPFVLFWVLLGPGNVSHRSTPFLPTYLHVWTLLPGWYRVLFPEESCSYSCF